MPAYFDRVWDFLFLEVLINVCLGFDYHALCFAVRADDRVFDGDSAKHWLKYASLMRPSPDVS